jgi:hypothetical protein
VHVKLNDWISGPNQAEKLALCGFQCRIRHHIEEANMHLTNILMSGTLETQDFLSFIAKSGKSGQIAVRY